MNLTEHFTLEELYASRTAAIERIDNYPPPAAINSLRRLCGVLEYVRTLFNAPVIVSSGYRCAELNKLVKGAPRSAHLLGCAADFTVPSFGDALTVAKRISQTTWLMEYVDQLIYEYGSWVHLAVPPLGSRPAHQLLTVGAHTHGKYVPGIFGA
jgi:zinc D-Ala-D-Ala carboxypeptidase